LRIGILISTICFIISIPVFLVSTDLRLAVNDVRLYEYGFSKYDVSLNTGIPDDELRDIALEIIEYYNSDEEFLDVDIYGEREMLHMKDVKGLVRLDYTVQMFTLGYIALYIIVGFIVKRGMFWKNLVSGLFWGSWLGISLIIVIGLWAIIDFNTLFYLFHLLSFSNELWQLSQSDQLLLMFPQGFFMEAALFVAGAVILQSLLILLSAWGILRIRKRFKAKV